MYQAVSYDIKNYFSLLFDIRMVLEMFQYITE